MPGELRDDAVIISDQKEGCQIYNKGNYGYPMSGGGLELDLIEATFLLESGRLKVASDGTEVTFPQLFDYSSGMYDEFDIKYMVYRDIRQRGFVVKMETGSFDMSVFPRGKTMSNSRPPIWSGPSPRDRLCIPPTSEKKSPRPRRRIRSCFTESLTKRAI